MANLHPSRPAVSTMAALPTLAGMKVARSLATVALLLVTLSCFAQDEAQPPASPESRSGSQASTPPQADTVTLPAGTRFALVLTHPIMSKTTRRGDEVYAQTTAPITVGEQVVIPAGTFVQGKLEKLSRNGSRGEMQMQSVAVVFPDGFVANVAGPMTIESDEGTAWKIPGGRDVAGAIVAPLAGLGIGTLIGHAAGGSGTNVNGMNFNPDGLKSTAIGGMVGLGVGGIASFIFIAHSRHFLVDVGSPMQMTLPLPLTLAGSQATAGASQAQPASPMPVAESMPPAPTVNTGTCYTPDTPGPPSIPGTPHPCP